MKMERSDEEDPSEFTAEINTANTDHDTSTAPRSREFRTNDECGLVGQFNDNYDEIISNFNSSLENEEFIFVQSTSNGRFRRCHKNDVQWKKGDDDDSHHTLLSSSRLRRLSSSSDHEMLAANRQQALKKIRHVAYVSFLFLQGILAGLAIQSMYEVFVVESAREFLLQYVHRSNETRRCYFLAISSCVTGSLCMIDEKAVTSMLPSFRDKMNSSGHVERANGDGIYLSVIYFLALGVTQVASMVDYEITANRNFERGIIPNDDGDEAQSIFDSWTGLAITRSVLCLFGWLYSCKQLYRRHMSGQQEVSTSSQP